MCDTVPGRDDEDGGNGEGGEGMEGEGAEEEEEEEDDDVMEAVDLDREVNYQQQNLVTTVTITALDEDGEAVSGGKSGRHRGDGKARVAPKQDDDDDDGYGIIQVKDKDKDLDIPKAKVFAPSTKKPKVRVFLLCELRWWRTSANDPFSPFCFCRTSKSDSRSSQRRLSKTFLSFLFLFMSWLCLLSVPFFMAPFSFFLLFPLFPFPFLCCC